MGVRTPAPWANVIANPDFGTVISESGAAYTWAENAHEWRLTPWHNDPVSDPSGETFYLRDEETGVAWMPNGVALNADGTPGRAASRATASATARSSSTRRASAASCACSARSTRRSSSRC